MRKITYLLVLLSISSSYVFADPVIDPASIKNQDKYYRDNAECKALAKDNKGGVGSVAKDTAIGAGIGAGTGGIVRRYWRQYWQGIGYWGCSRRSSGWGNEYL